MAIQIKTEDHDYYKRRCIYFHISPKPHSYFTTIIVGSSSSNLALLFYRGMLNSAYRLILRSY